MKTVGNSSILSRQRLEVGQIMGACLWAPRRLWNELGGFPAWFESLAEETYLCCLARLKGYSVIALPTSGYDHRVGGSLAGAGSSKGGCAPPIAGGRLPSGTNPLQCLSATLRLFLPYFPSALGPARARRGPCQLYQKGFDLWKQVYLSCMGEVWSNRRSSAQATERSAKRRIERRSGFSEASP